jgi:UDP-N-acetylglucosamine--N-acetylmuramyl-(pentapeptide) pyrophosphoryl-undecaprenol N-acetylglucosamine transferase
MDETNGELDSMHLLVAGGGTGGHIFPALAVAEEVRRGGGVVSFLGSRQGLEARLVPPLGIPFHHLPVAPLVGRGRLGQAASLGTTLVSALRGARLVRRLRATAVLGTGGFASAPGVVGGRLARRPTFLLEPNARPGVANRWLARVATGACVGWEASRERLACPTWVTGVPVRRVFYDRASQPPEGPPRLLVLGGSQGARQLNELLPAALAALQRPPRGLRVVHQAGEEWVGETRRLYEERPRVGVEVTVVPFLDEVAEAMARSHLLVCRAGAITLAELCAVGRGAVLVPLTLADAHQLDNAEVLARAGAAEVLTGGDLGPDRLAERLDGLLGDRATLDAMGRAARTLARPGAATEIVARLRAAQEAA